MNEEQTAYLGRPAIEAEQLKKLRGLLSELVPGNAFYAEKLKKVNLDIQNLEAFFDNFPFTTKKELVEEQILYPSYGRNLSYPVEEYKYFSQTSGTTGEPMRWLDTPKSWNWMLNNWIKILKYSQITERDRIFFAFSFGPFLGFWSAFSAAVKMGCLCIPGGGMSTVSRLETILINGVTVVCCTPTYAIRLGEIAREEGIDLASSKVRVIVCAGEPGGSIPSIYTRIERLWPGASVFDHHGLTEVGPVSYQCPVQKGALHVLEDSFIPEIINPYNGKRVNAGEGGELVLTNLGRPCSPLIRYRTGDLVRPVSSTPCACGTYELTLEGGILGRTDNMISMRGVNIYPDAIENIINKFDEIAEYRIEIRIEKGMREMLIRIEPAYWCLDPEKIARKLEKTFGTAFSLRIPVVIEEEGVLPRFEMKARRWVRI